MRLLFWFFAAMVAASAASAATLSPDELQTVLKNASLTEPGMPRMWYLEPVGDGKPYEQGGIAWIVYAYSRPHPLTSAFCVSNLVEIKVDTKLRVLRLGMRRKIALRPCSGLVPADFHWLHSFEDRQAARAINAVLAVAATGSAPGLTIKFASDEARAQASMLNKDRLISVSDFGDEMTVMFVSRVCGQPLVFAVDAGKHTMEVRLEDSIDFTDGQGHAVPPRCKD